MELALLAQGDSERAQPVLGLLLSPGPERLAGRPLVEALWKRQTAADRSS